MLANRAAELLAQLRSELRDWHDFYNSYDPAFSWWTHEAFDKLDADLNSYDAFLRKRLVAASGGHDDPVVGDPIGRAALLNALSAEMVPYTPEELIELAEKQFAWCQIQMDQAAHDLGCKNWREALDMVSKQHVKPGEQPGADPKAVG